MTSQKIRRADLELNFGKRLDPFKSNFEFGFYQKIRAMGKADIRINHQLNSDSGNPPFNNCLSLREQLSIFYKMT